MANIAYLNESDFVVLGQKQKTLGLSRRGNVLVFFKITNDNNCVEFEPVFAQLARKEQRVTCATLDVIQNRGVLNISRQTTTPINSVPVLILYVNGKPLAKFNGTRNLPSIQNFISNALQSAGNTASPPQPQQQFMPRQTPTNVFANQGNAAPPPGHKSYMPDIGNAPSMKGIIKGGNGGGYGIGNNVEEDDEPRLMVPDTVIPHNTPWEADMV